MRLHPRAYIHSVRAPMLGLQAIRLLKEEAAQVVDLPKKDRKVVKVTTTPTKVTALKSARTGSLRFGELGTGSTNI